MTTAEAVSVLRTIPAGNGTARERAIDYAIAQLLAGPTTAKPKPRKAAKPKTDPIMAGFLKMKLPTGVAAAPITQELREADKRLSPEARVQLSYGLRGRDGSDKARDAAILFAAAA